LVFNVTPPGAVMPFTVPMSSAKLVTVIAEPDPFVTDKDPLVDVLARLIILLLVAFVVKSTVPAARVIKFFKIILPVETDIPAPESNVNTPDPALGTKLTPDDNPPMVIRPELPPPIRALVVRIRLSSVCVKASVPVPVPMPMVVPAVPSERITFVALPVFAADPPICELVNNIPLAVKLIVPVESRREAEFNVSVPLPAFMEIVPEPVVTLVDAACVIPTPVNEILFAPLEETGVLIVSKPLVVIFTAFVIVPPVIPIVPPIVNPVNEAVSASFNVNAPPRVISEIVPKSLPEFPKLILLEVFAVKVFA